jgi:hypothetical protein
MTMDNNAPNPAIPGGSEEIMLDLGIRQSIKVASIMGAKLVGGFSAFFLLTHLTAYASVRARSSCTVVQQAVCIAGQLPACSTRFCSPILST